MTPLTQHSIVATIYIFCQGIEKSSNNVIIVRISAIFVC